MMDWSDVQDLTSDHEYDGQPIANACEFDGDIDQTNRYRDGSLWDIYIGGYWVYVWSGTLEDALEEAMDWAAEKNHCDAFVTLNEAELKDVAKGLGITWRAHWPIGHGTDTDWDAVVEQAETDLMIVGHTSYPNCTAYHLQQDSTSYGMLYVDDWNASEVSEDIYEGIARASVFSCYGLPFLIGDRVEYMLDEEVSEEDGVDIEPGIYKVERIDNGVFYFDRLFTQHIGVDETAAWEAGDPGHFKLLPPDIRPRIVQHKPRPRWLASSGMPAPVLVQPRTPPPPPPAPEPFVLTTREAALVSGMIDLGWYQKRSDAIEHIKRMRARGNVLSGLDDAAAMVVLYKTHPQKTFLGTRTPAWMRGGS